MDRTQLEQILPPGVSRVQVTDEMGKTRWRAPHEIADTDEIALDLEGNPVIMANKPGRPQKVDLQPASEVAAEVRKQKRDHINKDHLLNVITANPEKSEVLDHVMRGLAEEAASLAFERSEAERKGESTSQVSMRRVNALKAVGDSWLKRKEQITSSGVDMDSPAFRKVFALITETFKASLEEAGLRHEMIETVYAKFAKKLDDDWYKEASKRMSEG
jgi:hypothetical protein